MKVGAKSSYVVLRNNIQNSIFVRGTPNGADIFQKFLSNFIIKEIFGEVFILPATFNFKK